MNVLKGHWSSTRGARIYSCHWLPDRPVKACVVLVHGLAEHCGRYARLVEGLVSRGYGVFGHDHVGHGRSDGRRVYVRSFSDFTTVLRTGIHRVREQYPRVPIFLYAHSIGALIATVFLFDFDADPSGIVFSAPCVTVPSHVSPGVVLLARTLSRVVPKLGLQSIDATGISRDDNQVRAYNEDPFVYRGKTTARLAAEMLKAMQRVLPEADRITVPALILQGSADRIVDPDSARALHARLGSSDKQLILYDGLYHELHNEPESPRVLADVCHWLDARLS